MINIATRTKSRRPSKGDTFVGRRNGRKKQVVGFSRKSPDRIERVKLLDVVSGRVTLTQLEALHKNYAKTA